MNMDSVSPETVDKLASSINTYGPFAVLLAVMLIVLIAGFCIIARLVTKMNKYTIETNETLLNACIKIGEVKAEVTKDHNEDILGLFTKFNSAFRDQCKKIIETTGAVRSSIYVFHNGTTSSHGLPFFKMSCICEWIIRNSGVTSQHKGHQNLPLSIFSSLVESIYENGNIIIDMDSEDTDSSSIVFVASDTVKKCIITPVYDDNNTVMGFIRADYNFDFSPEDGEKFTKMVQSHAPKIQPVLQFSDYQKLHTD